MSRDQADRAFTNQYMQGDIDEIVDLIALEALEANGLWARYDRLTFLLCRLIPAPVWFCMYGI